MRNIAFCQIPLVVYHFVRNTKQEVRCGPLDLIS